MRRGTADSPGATLTTDADTLHAVTLGIRPIAAAAESGDLRLDGDPQAITGLTSLLQALTSPTTTGQRPEHDRNQHV
jgi:ubiquinone biosynthesis protein UbiJ